MIIYLPSLFICIVVTCLLGLQAFCDIKRGKLLISVTILIACFSIEGIIARTLPLRVCLFGAVLAFLPYFIVALMGKGGGGDALLLGALGALLGLNSVLYLIFITSTVYFFFLIGYKILLFFKKIQAREKFPFAPFIFCGWIILITYYILKGGISLWL